MQDHRSSRLNSDTPRTHHDLLSVHLLYFPAKKMSSSSARGSSTTSSNYAKRRTRLQGIAHATLEAIKQGSYTLNGSRYDLQLTVHFSAERTRYYAPESMLSAWSLTTSPQRVGDPPRGELSIIKASTLEGACSLAVRTSTAATSPSPDRKIGVLNFASAKKPGGGFLTGAQAQEESIARSSTITLPSSRAWRSSSMTFTPRTLKAGTTRTP